MCGLFGYFSSTNPVNINLIFNSLKNIEHRGPDQKGYWISCNQKIALAQTRLSINDLSNINLPITNENNSIQVIANAEIYNFLALKKELEEKGHHFKTNCDIEILPHLYEEYGINFINKLRGEFAFILWDDNQKSLYAVRDRFGIKPLYYKIENSDIYFSSEISTLLHLKNFGNKWNIEALYDFTHLSLPYNKTLFDGIYQIPPANYFLVRPNQSSLYAYWDVFYNPQNNLKFDETIEAVRDKLIEAVSIRSKSDVPVGCYLSGGIDSSALLGISTEVSGENRDAFTIEFEDNKINESDISARTSKFMKAKIHKVLITEENTIEYFEHVVKKTCFPIPNTAGVARYILSKFTKENGYKAVLSGEGADEVFLGYFGSIIEAYEDPLINCDFYLTEEQKKNFLQQIPIDKLAFPLPNSLFNFNSVLKNIPSWFKTQAYLNARHRDLLSISIRNSFSNYSPYVNLINSLNIQDKLKNFDNVQISSYTWLKSFFPNTMLNWIGDRVEMANGIEARQPYLDHELFELLAQVPTAMKLRGGVEKYLLREAAKPFVTEEVYKRKKFMFQAPPLSLNSKSKLYKLICEIILENINKTEIYQKQKIFALLDLSRRAENLSISNRIDISYTLTTVASMLILANHYNIS